MSPDSLDNDAIDGLQLIVPPVASIALYRKEHTANRSLFLCFIGAFQLDAQQPAAGGFTNALRRIHDELYSTVLSLGTVDTKPWTPRSSACVSS